MSQNTCFLFPLNSFLSLSFALNSQPDENFSRIPKFAQCFVICWWLGPRNKELLCCWFWSFSSIRVHLSKPPSSGTDPPTSHH